MARFDLQGPRTKATTLRHRRSHQGSWMWGALRPLLVATGTARLFARQCDRAHGRPASVLAHNENTGGQLCNELRGNSSEQRVEYFHPPIRLLPARGYCCRSRTPTSAQDGSINEENRHWLRQSAPASRSSAADVIVVASISCIYGLASLEIPQGRRQVSGGREPRSARLLRELVITKYSRIDIDVSRGRFVSRAMCSRSAPA